LRPTDKFFHCAVFTRHREPVTQTAGGLDQAGGLHIDLIDHDAWREIHEARAPVGFVEDDPADGEGAVAQQQLGPERHSQRVEQRGIDPGLAGLRDVAGQGAIRVWLLTHAQAPAQRVAGSHHFQRHQFDGATSGLWRARHGGETQGLHLCQAERFDLRQKCIGKRVVADHHRVTTHQLACIAL